MKIKVWIQLPDNVAFNESDIIEVPDNISDDELEKEARQVAFDHVDWGYENQNEMERVYKKC